YLMPTISYYFNTGPWRNLWVKFGYDPRTDPTSWCYQTFDFRVRQAGGAKTKVEAKRNYSNYILPYKSVHTCKKKTSLVSSIHLGEEAGGEGSGKKDGEKVGKPADGLSEEFYLFRPGMVPPYRQMFYQYCDIHVPKIQKLLESSILMGANRVCSERNGWLPSGVEITCRDILSNLIEKTLKERNEIGENLQEEELMSNTEDESSDGNYSEEENP
ncbi:General transcription factor 3C polypeptide 5, partial [Armadillidium nasatum]